MFTGHISYAISFSFKVFEIFANPPRLTHESYSLKRYFSPTGTRGAPCPPNLTSCCLKLHITLCLICFEISGRLPI